MDRRKKAELDRKHLESRARRFLTNYLSANEMQKRQFYKAVEAAAQKCRPTDSALPFEFDDSQIAEATADAAMKMVLAREGKSVPDPEARIANFLTDAYATVAVAYHRAASDYVDDREMQELGTAAVHLLTIATSYQARRLIRER